MSKKKKKIKHLDVKSDYTILMNLDSTILMNLIQRSEDFDSKLQIPAESFWVLMDNGLGLCRLWNKSSLW